MLNKSTFHFKKKNNPFYQVFHEQLNCFTNFTVGNLRYSASNRDQKRSHSKFWLNNRNNLVREHKVCSNENTDNAKPFSFAVVLCELKAFNLILFHNK